MDPAPQPCPGSHCTVSDLLEASHSTESMSSASKQVRRSVAMSARPAFPAPRPFFPPIPPSHRGPPVRRALPLPIVIVWSKYLHATTSLRLLVRHACYKLEAPGLKGAAGVVALNATPPDQSRRAGAGPSPRSARADGCRCPGRCWPDGSRPEGGRKVARYHPQRPNWSSGPILTPTQPKARSCGAPAFQSTKFHVM